MLDPLSRKPSLTPIDDEIYTDKDRQAVAEADRWLEQNQPIPLENVLADFGLTLNDQEAMSETSAPEDKVKPNA